MELATEQRAVRNFSSVRKRDVRSKRINHLQDRVGYGSNTSVMHLQMLAWLFDNTFNISLVI